MVPSYIARDVHIDAPIDLVWSIVTDPAQIVAWFADEAEIDLRAGGEGVFTFRSSERHPLTVETVDPPHTFAYHWSAAGGGRPADLSQRTRVEFALSEEDGGTRVRVTESGLRELRGPEDHVAAYAREHEEGWEHFLGRLAVHANGQPAGR